MKNILIVSNYSGDYGSEKMLKIITEGLATDNNVSLIIKNSTRQEIIKEEFGYNIQNLYIENFNIVSIKNKSFSFTSLWFWYEKLRTLKPDILLVNISLVAEIFFASRLLNIKAFVFIRESLIDYPKLFKFYVKYLKLLHVKIIVNSKYTASMFYKYNVKTYILYDTSDITITSFKDKLAIRKKSNYVNITYLGRLSYRKGIDILIKSIIQLSSKYNIRLNLIGGIRQGDEDYIASLLKTLQNYKNIAVKEYGFLKEPYSIVRKSDLVLATSNLPETFGLSVLESLSLGIPVIANNIGAYPELIENEYNGFLYNGTAIDLTKKVELFLTNKNNVNFKKNAYKSSLKFTKSKYLNDLKGIVK